MAQLEPQKDQYDFSLIREDLGFLKSKGKKLFVQLQDVTFSDTGRLFPKGFTFEIYRDAIITNMKALKRAFPKSVALQYANFMPGEWLPADDKGYLRAVYKAAKELNVGVGGPDLLPYRPGQRNHSYPLIQASAGIVPTGVAVQDGNYEDCRSQDRKACDNFRTAQICYGLSEGRLYLLVHRGAILLK